MSLYHDYLLKQRRAHSRVSDDSYVQNPKYTSVRQKKEETTIKARQAVDLTDTVYDPKYDAKHPTLAYVRHPDVQSLSQL